MSDVDGFLVQESDKRVVDDFDAQELALVFVLREGCTRSKVETWLLDLGQENRKQEGYDRIVHLENDLVICRDTFGNK